ncbi:site-specific integrase [Oscillatoria sp. FACHB-1407]|uniref:site-specific integrase n=1 Tax=Oscillatoria sp. FACHB-1407 TaxID=2692847 RepID=UPI0016852C3C|nr:site-specific integrase [Oscillatoria sp. FACHB-1407]MBD2463915.1 site-specific integrase [Oscillatoria sp. FACHB-1407]
MTNGTITSFRNLTDLGDEQYRILVQPLEQYLEYPLLQEISWNFQNDLHFSREELQPLILKNLNFDGFQLDWFCKLWQATILDNSPGRWGAGSIAGHHPNARKIDQFLYEKNYTRLWDIEPEELSQWAKVLVQSAKISVRALLLRWTDYGLYGGLIPWSVRYPTQAERQLSHEKKVISEFVWQQLIDAKNLNFFPDPIRRAILVAAFLGRRAVEIGRMPHECLVKRNSGYKLRLGFAKHAGIDEIDIPEELVPLIRKQQRWVRENCPNFDKLFCWMRIFHNGHSGVRSLGFKPELMDCPSIRINSWLEQYIQHCGILEENGELAYVTSHMFRHSLSDALNEVGIRVEVISRFLGHRNYRMTQVYTGSATANLIRKVNPEGKITAYKVAEIDLLLEKTTYYLVGLGLCARDPLTDCQHEQACWGCSYNFVGPEDLLFLHEREQTLLDLLSQLHERGQSDTLAAESIRQQLNLLQNRIEQAKDLKQRNE